MKYYSKSKIPILVLCIFFLFSGFILNGSQDADKIARELAKRLSNDLDFDTTEITERELMINVSKMMDNIIFDAVKISYKGIKVKKIENRYKLVGRNNHYILDFGSDEKAARLTWLLFKTYGIERICFVGRPKSSFSFVLSGGETRVNSKKSFYKVTIPGTAPAGDYPSITSSYKKNLKVIKFQRNRLKLMEYPLERIWKYRILSRNTTILKFSNRSEAIASFAFINLYKFNQKCTIYAGGKLKRQVFIFMRRVTKTLKIRR